MEQQSIPDFMQGYYQGSNPEGRVSLEQLAKSYDNEKATFLQTTFVQKKAFERDWNKVTGRRDNLTPDQALAPMQEKYREFAELKAKEHGYVAPKNAPGQKVQERPTPQQLAEKREAFIQNLQSMRIKQQTPSIRRQ